MWEKKVEKRKPLHAAGGIINWHNHCEKQYGRSSKKKKPKLKIELPYAPAFPLLGIYSEKTKNTNLKRYTNLNIHSSTIYNN